VARGHGTGCATSGGDRPRGGFGRHRRRQPWSSPLTR
jgi:hypothetical protein